MVQAERFMRLCIENPLEHDVEKYNYWALPPSNGQVSPSKNVRGGRHG